MSLHSRLQTVTHRLEAVLDRANLHDLTPTERAETLSLLLIELQRRIGLNLLPHLDEDSEKHFKSLVERKAGSDELTAFFSIRIPDYQERVERIIESFCEECHMSLSQLSLATI